MKIASIQLPALPRISDDDPALKRFMVVAGDEEAAKLRALMKRYRDRSLMHHPAKFNVTYGRATDGFDAPMHHALFLWARDELDAFRLAEWLTIDKVPSLFERQGEIGGGR